MAQSKMISFDELITGRDSSVRVTSDNLLYAVDLAMAGTGKSRNYAGQVIYLTHEKLVRYVFNSRETREIDF